MMNYQELDCRHDEASTTSDASKKKSHAWGTGEVGKILYEVYTYVTRNVLLYSVRVRIFSIKTRLCVKKKYLV